MLWTLVGILAIRRAVAELPVFLPPTADAYAFIDSGRQALANPGAIYPAAAAMFAAGNPWTVLWPPAQTLMAVPFGLLPPPADVWVWVITNALMSTVGLILIYRVIRVPATWSAPAYVLTVLLFTPLFEDVRLGQRGGPLVLLAAAAMITVRRHPLVAGALTGLGTAIKFYPAAMAFAVEPRQWSRFTGALTAVASVVVAITFIPFGNPLAYLTGILIPTLFRKASLSHDCFQNSTSLLYARLVGGQGWSVTDGFGAWHDVTFIPWHLPLLAQVLTYLTFAALFAGTVWAARRSGWAQPFSLSLAFSLGALVPGEAFTYQFIAMLPLTLVLVMKSIERRRWVTIAVVSLAIWFLLSSPCSLIFPGLWTISGLTIFCAAVVQSRLFREPESLESSHQAVTPGTGAAVSPPGNR